MNGNSTIRERYDESKIEIDIETAKREFLPITIQFNKIKEPIVIREVTEPIKFNVVTRLLDSGYGEILGKIPPTIEIEIVTPFIQNIFIGDNLSDMEACLSFNKYNRQFKFANIYGFITNYEMNCGSISSNVWENSKWNLHFKFVGVIGNFNNIQTMEGENKEIIKRKINRRFTF